MVLVGQIIRTGIQIASRFTKFGTVSRYSKSFTRYDKGLHGSVFGKSGGKGFRHGRDAGLAISGAAQGFRGDDLNGPIQPRYSFRSKPQAYSRRSNKRSSGRRQQCSCNHCRRYRSSFR